MSTVKRLEEWMTANAGASWAMAALLAIIAWQEYRAYSLRQELAQERECKWSVTCQDRTASSASWIEEYPVQSTTGRWFFQGKACREPGCLEMQSGYRWAERIGATKSGACVNSSPEFQDGCMAYIGIYETIPSIEKEVEEREPPDLPGRAAY